MEKDIFLAPAPESLLSDRVNIALIEQCLKETKIWIWERSTTIKSEPSPFSGVDRRARALLQARALVSPAVALAVALALARSCGARPLCLRTRRSFVGRRRRRVLLGSPPRADHVKEV